MALPAEDFPVSPSTNVGSQQLHHSPFQEAQRSQREDTKHEHQSQTSAHLGDGPSGLKDASSAAPSMRLHPGNGDFPSSSLSPILVAGSPSFSQQDRRLRRPQQLDLRRPSTLAEQRIASSKASWSRKPSDLPSVSVPLGRSADSPFSRTASAQRRRGPASSKHFLTVFPPEDFPIDRANTRSGTASSYAHLRRGALIPLYPTLNGQLYAISREYGLPSIAGLSIYLCEDGDGNLGPRIGEGTWEALWSRYFTEDDEDFGSGLGGSRFVAPLSPFFGDRRSQSRSVSQTKAAYDHSPGGAINGLRTPEMQGNMAARHTSDDMRSTMESSPHWRAEATQGYPSDNDASFNTVSSTSRMIAALPIVGRVEWTVDKLRASWWASWAGEVDDHQSLPLSATSSRQRKQRSLQLSKGLGSPAVGLDVNGSSSTSVEPVQDARKSTRIRDDAILASVDSPSTSACAHQRQLSPSQHSATSSSQVENPQSAPQSSLRISMQRNHSDRTVAAEASSLITLRRATEDATPETTALLTAREPPTPSEPPSQAPSYTGYTALGDGDESGRTTTEDEETRGSSSIEGSVARARRRKDEDDPERSLPSAPHTRGMTFEIVTDSDESIWRSLHDAPHPPATIGLSHKALTSYHNSAFGNADPESLNMSRQPNLINDGRDSVSRWIVDTESSPDLIKRRSVFIQECVGPSVDPDGEEDMESEPARQDDVKDVLELWAETAPVPVFAKEQLPVEGLGLDKGQTLPAQDLTALSIDDAAEAKLKLLSPIALDDVSCFQGAPPQLGDLTAVQVTSHEETTPRQDVGAFSDTNGSDNFRLGADKDKDMSEMSETVAPSSRSSDSSGLEDFERALQLLSPVASAPTHSPSLAQLAMFEDGHKMSSRDSLFAARTLSTSVTPSPRWLSRRRTPGSQGFDLRDRRFSASNAGDSRRSRGSSSLATISASSSRLAEQIGAIDGRRTVSASQALQNSQSHQRLSSAPGYMNGSSSRQSHSSAMSYGSSLHPDIPEGDSRRLDRHEEDGTSVHLDKDSSREDSRPASLPVIAPPVETGVRDNSLAVDAVQTDSPDVSRSTSLPDNSSARLDGLADEKVLPLPSPGNSVRADSVDTVVPQFAGGAGSLFPALLATQPAEDAGPDLLGNSPNLAMPAEESNGPRQQQLASTSEMMTNSPRTPSKSPPPTSRASSVSAVLPASTSTGSGGRGQYGLDDPQSLSPGTDWNPSSPDSIEEAIPSVARMIRAESFGASSATTSSAAQTPGGRSFSSSGGDGEHQLSRINVADSESGLSALASSSSFEETLMQANAHRSPDALHETEDEYPSEQDTQLTVEPLQEVHLVNSTSVASMCTDLYSDDGILPRADSKLTVGLREDDTIMGEGSPGSWTRGDRPDTHSRESGSHDGENQRHLSAAGSGFSQLDDEATPTTPAFFFDRHLRDADDSRPSSLRVSDYSAFSSPKATETAADRDFPDDQAAAPAVPGLLPASSASARDLRQSSSLSAAPLIGSDGDYESESDVPAGSQREESVDDGSAEEEIIEEVLEADEKMGVITESMKAQQPYRQSTTDVTKDLEAMLSSIETFASSSDHGGRRWSRPTSGMTASKPSAPFDSSEDSLLAYSRSTTLPNLVLRGGQRTRDGSRNIESNRSGEIESIVIESTHQSQVLNEERRDQDLKELQEDDNDIDPEHDLETTRRAVRQALGRSDPSMVVPEVAPFRALSSSPEHYSGSDVHRDGSPSSHSARGASGGVGRGVPIRSRSGSPHRRPSVEPPRRSSGSTGSGTSGIGADHYYFHAPSRPSLMSPRGRFKTLPPSPGLAPEEFLKYHDGKNTVSSGAVTVPAEEGDEHTSQIAGPPTGQQGGQPLLRPNEVTRALSPSAVMSHVPLSVSNCANLNHTTAGQALRPSASSPLSSSSAVSVCSSGATRDRRDDRGEQGAGVVTGKGRDHQTAARGLLWDGGQSRQDEVENENPERERGLPPTAARSVAAEGSVLGVLHDSPVAQTEEDGRGWGRL